MTNPSGKRMGSKKNSRLNFERKRKTKKCVTMFSKTEPSSPVYRPAQSSVSERRVHPPPVNTQTKASAVPGVTIASTKADPSPTV